MEGRREMLKAKSLARNKVHHACPLLIGIWDQMQMASDGFNRIF